MTLKVFKREANATIFADPTDPAYQVRVKNTSSSKNLKGTSVTNYVTEFIATDTSTVEVNGTKVDDAISVRIRVSGSQLSENRLMQIFKCMSFDLPLWQSEGVLLGFEPATMPSDPDTIA